MAGPILRLKDMKAYVGLSRTAIYDRMDENSPRYEKDFPKSFRLGGGAIGWFQSDVDAWLESCAATAKHGTKAKKTKASPDPQKQDEAASTKTRAKPASSTPASQPSKRSVSEPIQSAPQSAAKQTPRPGNLAETIVEGGRINDRILYHLQMKEWTPPMGAMLVSGIDPPPDSQDIPEGGMGLDGIELHTSNARFNEARRILREWHDWKEDTQNQVLNMEPTRFLNWCLDENFKSNWLRLILELAGMEELSSVDLTASRFALLTNR